MPIEQAFAEVTSPDNLDTFVGFGPIPGILEATVEGEDALGEGAVLRVRNTDGSTHRERIEVLEPPSRYRIRIFDFDSAFRHLVDHAIEQLDFSRYGGRTAIAREFRFTLKTTLLAPAAYLLLHGFFGPALTRNYNALRERIRRHSLRPPKPA